MVVFWYMLGFASGVAAVALAAYLRRQKKARDADSLARDFEEILRY